MTTNAYPHSAKAGSPRPAYAPVFVSVAAVMLGSVAIPSTPVRWLDAVRYLRRTRAVRRTYPSRRPDYFESAAMAREMHRL
jgi:hypothetical protein